MRTVTSVPRVSTGRPPVAAMVGLALVATVAAGLGPSMLTTVLIGLVGVLIVSMRPAWGVATLLTMLMVQYGSRRFERTGSGSLAALIPAGEGLVTVNNILGVYLLLILVYQLYRESDWSFLKSRQVQIVGLITILLILSAIINKVDYAEQAAIGLRVTGQNPMRTMVSRLLFLLLFVAFVRSPKELKLLVGAYVLLSVITAYNGSVAGLTETASVPQAADYRAGGLGVLIETAGNPNRLAMIATLALVFIWEHGQSQRPTWLWVNYVLVLFLVVTVFLTASRGGVIGLAAATLLLFARRRGLGRRFLYGGAIVLAGAILVAEIIPQENMERLSNIPGISSDTEAAGGGSIERREYTYGVALNLWSSSPIIGIGMGNWEYKRYTLDPLRSAAVPHNSFLLETTEGGFVTIALYLLLYSLTILGLINLERNPETLARLKRDGVDWLIGATRICLMTFLVFSFFGDLWELIFFYFLFGLAGSLISVYGGSPDQGAYA
jgi:O-antigen ligase